jgi:hypothetical protein
MTSSSPILHDWSEEHVALLLHHLMEFDRKWDRARWRTVLKNKGWL